MSINEPTPESAWMTPLALSQRVPVTRRQMGDDFVATFSGRDIHACMEIDEAFTVWIRDGLERYGFVHHQDFQLLTLPADGRWQRSIRDYAITLPVAHILVARWRYRPGITSGLRVALLEYIRQCERKERSEDSMIQKILSNPAHLRLMLLTYAERV